MRQDNRKAYRLEGLTCAGCAAQFERHVREIPGVEEAQVHFGSSKLTVVGEVSLDRLQKAGAVEGIRIFPEQEPVREKPAFWKKPENRRLLGAALLLLIGWALGRVYGEGGPESVPFYAASMLLGGTGLFLKGFRNLARFRFDMNTLMTVAILGAAAIGEWSEGASVVILFAVSEALEKFSMDRARRSIRSLMELAPEQAAVRRDGREIIVPVREVQPGDLMIVKPGQKLAMDGIVTRGTSAVNQAAITGEPLPVFKEPGDEVFAGTLNGEGMLEVRVTKRAEETAIAKIIHLVEEAQARRSPTQAFIDRFAAWYTPAILLMALLVTAVPPLFFGGEWGEWIYRGLALLVTGCPCALIISTPVTVVTAIGRAAKSGVLIKGGIHLEQAGGISVIAFDKTGTLTKGSPVVTDFIPLSGDPESLLAVAAAMEKRSAHPLASAVVRKAKAASLDVENIPVEGFRSVTGKGVQADVGGKTHFLGSPTLLQERMAGEWTDEVRARISMLESRGKTVMLLGTETEVLALIGVADEVREGAAETVSRLRDLGIRRTVMLTGDNRRAAEAVANQAGIDEVKAGLLPEEKLSWIRRLRDQGKAAMVGDGVNDAPALAAADTGIAMGGAGSDAALETADIVIMGDDLRKLPFLVRLSRRAMTVIRQNVTFSLGIKLAALLLIIPGWLTLWMAVFADMGATLLVTLNGMRLLRVRE